MSQRCGSGSVCCVDCLGYADTDLIRRWPAQAVDPHDACTVAAQATYTSLLSLGECVVARTDPLFHGHIASRMARCRSQGEVGRGKEALTSYKESLRLANELRREAAPGSPRHWHALNHANRCNNALGRMTLHMGAYSTACRFMEAEAELCQQLYRAATGAGDAATAARAMGDEARAWCNYALARARGCVDVHALDDVGASEGGATVARALVASLAQPATQRLREARRATSRAQWAADAASDADARKLVFDTAGEKGCGGEGPQAGRSPPLPFPPGSVVPARRDCMPAGARCRAGLEGLRRPLGAAACPARRHHLGDTDRCSRGR